MNLDGLSFRDSEYELALRTEIDMSRRITAESIEASRLKKREMLAEV